MKHGNFCTTRRLFAHAHYKLEFDYGVIQMIIAHKVFILFTSLKDESKKIKLRWQWKSVYIEIVICQRKKSI